MEKQNFKTCIMETVKEIINCISEKNYEDLEQLASIDDEWIEEEEGQEEGFARFSQWLEEQLSTWSEDTGEEFTVDNFDEEYLEVDFDDDESDCAFATYTPTSDCEDLDIWFEFKCILDENDKVNISFTVNM